MDFNVKMDFNPFTLFCRMLLHFPVNSQCQNGFMSRHNLSLLCIRHDVLVIKLTMPIRQLQLQSYDFSCKNALVAVIVISI